MLSQRVAAFFAKVRVRVHVLAIKLCPAWRRHEGEESKHDTAHRYRSHRNSFGIQDIVYVLPRHLSWFNGPICAVLLSLLRHSLPPAILAQSLPKWSCEVMKRLVLEGRTYRLSFRYSCNSLFDPLLEMNAFCQYAVMAWTHRARFLPCKNLVLRSVRREPLRVPTPPPRVMQLLRGCSDPFRP
jgi:hypothetical protein